MSWVRARVALYLEVAAARQFCGRISPDKADLRLDDRL